MNIIDPSLNVLSITLHNKNVANMKGCTVKANYCYDPSAIILLAYVYPLDQ